MLSRYSEPVSSVASAPAPLLGGPTFALKYRLMRLFWALCWTVFASWTPPAFQPMRRLLLQAFGADIHPTAMVRGSARIWWPRNLSMGAHSSVAPGAICYNVAKITIEEFAVISQRAHICTASHDVDDPGFPLIASPVRIGRNAWIAAEAFVGPGVLVGEGAVLGARGVAARDLGAWTIYVGNPARPVRERRRSGSSSTTRSER